MIYRVRKNVKPKYRTWKRRLGRLVHFMPKRYGTYRHTRDCNLYEAIVRAIKLGEQP